MAFIFLNAVNKSHSGYLSIMTGNATANLSVLQFSAKNSTVCVPGRGFTFIKCPFFIRGQFVFRTVL